MRVEHPFWWSWDCRDSWSCCHDSNGIKQTFKVLPHNKNLKSLQLINKALWCFTIVRMGSISYHSLWSLQFMWTYAWALKIVTGLPWVRFHILIICVVVSCSNSSFHFLCHYVFLLITNDQGQGKRSGHFGHGRTNIYATSLPANYSDTTAGVAIWAWLAIRVPSLVWIGMSESHLWVESSKNPWHDWTKMAASSKSSAEWKVKSGTKQTSHRPLHSQNEGLERWGPCISLSNPPGSRNGHESIMIKPMTKLFVLCT